MVTDLVTESQEGFSVRLRARARSQNTWLCIGLDPDVERFPHGLERTSRGVVSFCRAIVESTAESAAAFKINFAFFEALGEDGWKVLDEVRRCIPSGTPVIADAKRGDIPNTATAYARAILGELGFDALTVNPYLGWDSVLPYFDYGGRGVFLLCKTSNPGSSDFQELVVDGEPLFVRVAREALVLRERGDVGLVVGATDLGALAAIRRLDDDVVLLVPGVGAQGGSLSDAVRLAANTDGENALVTVSRSIVHASSGPDFAEVASHVAAQIAEQTGRGISHAGADR